jgi:hypothetical protein
MVFMGIFQKLKTVKGKWLYLGLVVLVLLVTVGIAGKIVHHHFEERYGGYNNLSGYQTFYDLLYLENTANTKISTEQAKTLMPLVEKLSNVDKTAQIQLMKNIYEQLTPEQYYTLLTANRQRVSGEDAGKWGRLKRELEHKWRHGRDKKNIRNEILKDIVVKMMKDISSK